MDFRTESYRWGLEHLHETNPAWRELQEVLRSIDRQEIIAIQAEYFDAWMRGERATPPAGGQTTVNRLIEARLADLGWETQVPVIPAEDGRGPVPYWSMDFIKDRIGLEVSFNNAGVLPQNLLRMSVKAESHLLNPDEMIRLGILIVATEDLKTWSRMDSTVHTFEQVRRVLRYVTFSVPTPIVVVGLNNSTQGEAWPVTDLFQGRKLPRFDQVSEERAQRWHETVAREAGPSGSEYGRTDARPTRDAADTSDDNHDAGRLAF